MLAEQHEQTAATYRELAALEAEPTTEDVYSVRRPMPGSTRRWMRTHLRHMPGAYLVGREWRVSRADALAYVATLTAARKARRRATVKATSNVVDVADWIASAGMRATRGGR